MRSDESGAICKSCKAQFVVTGSPEDKARMRCQCSPLLPLEYCKSCDSNSEKHPDWCSRVLGKPKDPKDTIDESAAIISE